MRAYVSFVTENLDYFSMLFWPLVGWLVRQEANTDVKCPPGAVQMQYRST